MTNEDYKKISEAIVKLKQEILNSVENHFINAKGNVELNFFKVNKALEELKEKL